MNLMKAAMMVAVSALVATTALGKETSATAAGNGEFRGVWLTREQLMESREALGTRLDKLRDAGFQRVAIATQVRGYTALPDSKILPQWPDLKAHDEKIVSWLVDEIQKRGMKADSWTEYGFYAYWTPDKEQDKSRGVILDKNPEMTAMTADGIPYHHDPKLGYFYAFCPSNPKTHEVLISLYDEMMGQAPFDGLNLDRIRFTNDKFCHCDHCKEAFKKETGFELKAQFPKGSAEAKAMGKWRGAQTREFVRKLSEKFRKDHPGKMLSSAVVSPDLIEEKGQDWPTWIEQGYLDAVMPMLYDNTLDRWVAWIIKRLGNDDKIFYGIDAAQGLPIFTKQVEKLRTVSAPGFMVWEGGSLGKIIDQWTTAEKGKSGK